MTKDREQTPKLAEEGSVKSSNEEAPDSKMLDARGMLDILIKSSRLGMQIAPDQPRPVRVVKVKDEESLRKRLAYEDQMKKASASGGKKPSRTETKKQG